MKTRIIITTIALLTVALFASGCAITSGKSAGDFQVLQAALTTILPPGYEGDLEGDHDGYYFGTSVHLDFNLRGLKQVDGKWTWEGGSYKRKGFFSQGGIRLTPKEGKTK